MRRHRTSVDDAALLRPHDHAVWFGTGPADLYAVASSALAEGLRRNELLMLVADAPDPAGLSGLGDVERLLARKQLALLPVEDVYGGRSFRPDSQLARFQSVLAGALAEGYSGIRVVADNTALACGSDTEFQSWLSWEQLTDRFQATAQVTGVCFFDAAALGPARRADVVALHPVRSIATSEPPFSLFVEDDAVCLVGSLGATAGEQLCRLLETVEQDRTQMVMDLTAAHVTADEPLLALAAWAGSERALRVRGSSGLARRVGAIGPAAANLKVEPSADPPLRCSRCGDAIGAYEQVMIVFGDEVHAVSVLAEPAAVAAADGRYHRDCHATG